MSINSQHFIENLQNCISAGLPGIEAQKLMSPLKRVFEPDKNVVVRNSAVLIPIILRGNSVKIIVIERAKYNGYHSGQIAFPGGKSEKFDNDIVETALREANEEIGIEKDRVTVLGKLTSLYIPVSNINVSPIVAYVDWTVSEAIANYEVQSVIEIDLEELCNPKNIKTHTFKEHNMEIEAPCFKVNNIVIWGATAMIIKELLEVVSRCENLN